MADTAAPSPLRHLLPNSRLRMLWLTVAASFLFFTQGLLTLPDYGMGWDEPVRWRNADVKLDYYQNLTWERFTQGHREFAGDTYPALFDLPLAWWHDTFGGDRMYQGHVWSLCFATLGLVGTAWMARTVFGASTAPVAVLLLALLPNFYGHAMINPKDIPFLGMYTLGLAGVMHGTRRLLLRGEWTWWEAAGIGLLIGLAGSARIPGLSLLPMLGVFSLVALAWRWSKGRDRAMHGRSWVRLTAQLGMLTAAALIPLAVFFPVMHGAWLGGVSNAVRVVQISAREIPLLLDGVVTTAGQAPGSYAAYLFILTTPLWMLAALTLGGFCLLLRSRRAGPRACLLMLFACAAAFPWAYLTLRAPALHNGVRHLLFAIPPLMALAGYGLTRGLQTLRQRRPGFHQPARAILLLACLAQAVTLVRLHPYQYVYYNALAGPKESVPNRFEAEYWFTSTKHLLEALPEVAARDGLRPDPSQSIPICVAGPLDVARPFLPLGFHLVYQPGAAVYFVANTTFRTDTLAEGEIVHEIQRLGMPIGRIIRVNHPAP